jgi:hypothetical protein
MQRILALCLLIGLVACAHAASFIYHPMGTFKGQGDLQVGSFRYIPLTTLKVRENQPTGLLPTTRTDRPLAEVLMQGLRAEIIHAGLTPKGLLAVQGTITRVEMNRLTLPARCRLTIEYEMTYKGKALYGVEVTTEGRAVYYGESLDAINDAMGKSFDQLMTNPKVQKLIAFYTQPQ